MNKIECIDKREQLRQEAEGLISGAETEKRALTADEDARISAIKGEMDELDVKIAKIDDDLKRAFRARPAAVAPATQEVRGFSLVKAIRDIAGGKPLEDAEAEVVNEGIALMHRASLPFAGKIVLPATERRGVIQATVATAGMENVETDLLGIVGALRNRLVMVQAGASYLTGLVGNVSIPVYSGSNVNWEGETAQNQDGAGTFGDIPLSPKRLSAKLDISKQFLLQDSNSAESLLRADLVRAVAEKLESTILGSAAGTATQPAGIFNLITPITVATYADTVTMEQTLESANVYGNPAYLLSPTAKAFLRSTQKASGIGFILEDKELNGLPSYSSNGITADGLVLGEWTDYIIGQWGGIDVVVDPYTQADRGIIRLVVNAFFDAKPRRNQSFVTATV